MTTFKKLSSYTDIYMCKGTSGVNKHFDKIRQLCYNLAGRVKIQFIKIGFKYIHSLHFKRVKVFKYIEI